MFHVKPLIFLFLLFPFLSFAQMGSTSLEVKDLPELPKKNIEIENYIMQFSESKLLSSSELDWFYWTNFSRNNPIKFWDSIVAPIIATYPKLNNFYTNSLKKDLYSTNPLPLIKPNLKLKNIGQELALALAKKNAPPSHTSPSGSTFQDRMQKESIKTCAGENISFGPDNPVLMLVLLYIDQGVPDLGHRKTLLNPLFSEMGIGISVYPDNKVLVVQDFACNQTN